MAIRTFNSVGGFSVGEVPSNVILANGDITTGNANLTGNIAAFAVKTDNYLYANGNPVDFNTAVGNTGEIQFKSSGTDLASSLNLVFYTNNSTLSTTNFIANGNVSAGNANISANINAGNLITTGFANIGGRVNVALDANVIGLLSAGNIATAGSANVGNVNVSGYVTSALLPGTNVALDLGSSTHAWRDLWLSGNSIHLGNTVLTSNANTLVTQDANITGNLTAGTLTVTGDSALQGNAVISGNLTVGGNTTYINVTNLAVEDPLIVLGGSANGANATSYDGKDRGIIFKNYVSSTASPISQFFGWKSGSSEFQAVADVSNYNGEVVTANSLANIRANVFFGNLTGTVLTAAQPNITSLGNLTGLNVAGNLNVSNIANVNTLKASGLTYPTSDGTASQVLSTYGNGTLYFNTISTNSLSNGNSNVVVNANSNVNISSNGVPNVVAVSGTGANITGNLNVSGSFAAGNVQLSSVVLGNTSVNWATKTTTSVTTGQIVANVATSNVRGVIFDVTGEDAGGKYSLATVSALYNGTSVDYSVYGTVNLGGSTGSLSADLTNGNITLKVSPATSNSTVWVTQYRTI